MRYTVLIVLSIILSSCATIQSREFPININLVTVNSDSEPIDAHCSLYSSSAKLETLAPKKIIFKSQCSSINIICKSGNLYGEYGVLKVKDTSAEESFLISTGIGYLFDRAVDTVTPMGSLINLLNNEEEECITDRDITIVLE